MNVYDFDKTIYKGDSTLDFYIFCLKRQPLLIFLLPIQINGLILYKLGLTSKVKFKERFYIFLKYVKRREESLDLFWNIHKNKIQTWYLERQNSNDLVISASPQFLLEPICESLGIKHLIASKVEFKTGKCLSENCYGQEKVKRYNEQFEQVEIKEFYSDSLTDSPLALIANNSYGVIGERIIPWEEFEKLPKQSSTLKEFLLFLVIGVVNTFNGVIFATLFSLLLNGIVAFLLGYVCSLIISYILNSFFVFKKTLSYLKFIKFCLSYIPNFLIQLIIVTVFLNIYYFEEFLVYTISAMLGVPITFLMIKFFALKK